VLECTFVYKEPKLMSRMLGILVLAFLSSCASKQEIAQERCGNSSNVSRCISREVARMNEQERIDRERRKDHLYCTYQAEKAVEDESEFEVSGPYGSNTYTVREKSSCHGAGCFMNGYMRANAERVIYERCMTSMGWTKR
jgi:hypothetical protein